MRLAPLGLLLALGAVACSGNSTSTTPTPPTTTDTFTGTVPVGGSDAHNFTVVQNSEVDVTLTAAAPPDGIVMGIGIGSGGSPCTLFAQASAQTSAGTSVQLAGGLSPGSFCVSVFDVGNQTDPVIYTVMVAHR